MLYVIPMRWKSALLSSSQSNDNHQEGSSTANHHVAQHVRWLRSAAISTSFPLLLCILGSQPGAQAELEESLAAGVGELAVGVRRRVAAVLLRLDATVVQFGADDLSLARVVPAKLIRFVVTLGAVLLSVAAVSRCDADFLPPRALVVTGLTSTTSRFYQHLQLRLHRPLAPVLLGPA